MRARKKWKRKRKREESVGIGCTLLECGNVDLVCLVVASRVSTSVLSFRFFFYTQTRFSSYRCCSCCYCCCGGGNSPLLGLSMRLLPCLTHIHSFISLLPHHHFISSSIPRAFSSVHLFLLFLFSFPSLFNLISSVALFFFKLYLNQSVTLAHTPIR